MAKTSRDILLDIDHPLGTSQSRIEAINDIGDIPDSSQLKVDSKNDWTERLDVALTNIMNTVSDLRGKHTITGDMFENRSNFLGVSLILLSSIVSLFLVLPADTLNIIPIFAKVLSFIVSGLTVLNQFFKFAEKSLQHRTISKKYVSLYNNIYSQLVIGDYFKRAPGTQFISWVLKNYNVIVSESPPIPAYISRTWKIKKAKLKEQEALSEYTFDPGLFKDIPIAAGLLNPPTVQSQTLNTDLEMGAMPEPKGSKLLAYNLGLMSNSD